MNCPYCGKPLIFDDTIVMNAIFSLKFIIAKIAKKLFFVKSIGKWSMNVKNGKKHKTSY